MGARCLLLGLYTVLVLRAYCTTHWLLTEDDKIQAQVTPTPPAAEGPARVTGSLLEPSVPAGP